ncbi:hypothetical protein R70211_06768 [Paraburkholderia domus]|uniref:Uncharacterized protein n=2 Tax=Paraburkholderia domus TaxID=2793075 RepID=A0A9N8NDC1_9BURK|nr:hypothetical protein [Burkholderia sp. R-70211]CAE6958610.1 hypothetical protein R70211_06768 [Paraburkholderia domus]
MKTLYGIARHTGGRYAVFKVPTNLGDVFMKIARDESTAVVEVDAERFLDLWRGPLSSHCEVAHGTVDTWPSDYKFADAEEGFSEGEWNPVPLALVSCATGHEYNLVESRSLFGLRKRLQSVQGKQHDQLSFTNGVTRTIWLLTAGAKAFPVSCHVDDAPLLQERAGANDTRFMTTAELLPDPTREQALAELMALNERTEAKYGRD